MTARPITIADLEAARPVVAGLAWPTPLLASRALGEMMEAPIWLKAEVLQRTGSFKVRGAANFIAQLDAAARAAGVVAASAGNHAQGVAVAAAAAGVPCTVIMPHGTALPKERATRGYGATVILAGANLGDAQREAADLARRSGSTLIPPFDDDRIIAGQGTLGLELLEQCPALDLVVLPVGGGGLAAGVGLAVKSLRPQTRVLGVQPAAAPSAACSHGAATPLLVPLAPTLADGCAVPRVGERTLPMLNAYLDEIVTVSEEWISAAMVWLLERAKLVVEGAGALGLAALLSGSVEIQGRTTAVVLSGGNIDINLLARTVEHGLARAGRYLRVDVIVPDRPGQLARVLEVVGAQGVNVLDVDHRRNAPDLPWGSVGVELLLETRDADHARALTDALARTGLQQFPTRDGVTRLRDPALPSVDSAPPREDRDA